MLDNQDAACAFTIQQRVLPLLGFQQLSLSFHISYPLGSEACLGRTPTSLDSCQILYSSQLFSAAVLHSYRLARVEDTQPPNVPILRIYLAAAPPPESSPVFLSDDSSTPPEEEEHETRRTSTQCKESQLRAS